jgi:hypothetical protein
MAGRATFTIDVSMMTMKLATHAMARMTPGRRCGRTAGPAGAAAVLRWDMTATPSGRSLRFRTY